MNITLGGTHIGHKTRDDKWAPMIAFMTFKQ